MSIQRFEFASTDDFGNDGPAFERLEVDGEYVRYEDHLSRLAAFREALEHIEKTCGQSRTVTRRLRWIAKRAELALAGRPYVAAEHELPVSVEKEHLKMMRQNSSLRERLADAERRNASIIGKVDKCKVCGSNDLYWFAQNTVPNGIQQNRLNTHDVKCLFVLGCNECSETLKLVNSDTIAERMTAALNPKSRGRKP